MIRRQISTVRARLVGFIHVLNGLLDVVVVSEGHVVLLSKISAQVV